MAGATPSNPKNLPKWQELHRTGAENLPKWQELAVRTDPPARHGSCTTPPARAGAKPQVRTRRPAISAQPGRLSQSKPGARKHTENPSKDKDAT